MTISPQTMCIIAAETSVQSTFTDCEWNAADRYDDGRYAVSDLAQRRTSVSSARRKAVADRDAETKRLHGFGGP
jgi:hypothetical protein